ADIVSSKYSGDKDAVSAAQSAKETVIYAQQTEEKLSELKEYTKKVDQDVKNLEGISQKKDKEISTLKDKIVNLEKRVEELKIKLRNKNWFLASAGLLCLVLSSLILKRWKWFI